MENKARIYKIVTIAIMVFIVLLVAAMVINLIKLGKVNSREKALAAELAEYDRLIQAQEDEIAYKSTQEYIDRYAREYLNMIGKDEDAFKAA